MRRLRAWLGLALLAVSGLSGAAAQSIDFSQGPPPGWGMHGAVGTNASFSSPAGPGPAIWSHPYDLYAGNSRYLSADIGFAANYGMPPGRSAHAWFYDDMEGCGGGGATVQAVEVQENATYPASAAALGVFTGTSACDYVMRHGASFADTGVARNRGWHHFDFTWQNARMVLNVDGRNVSATDYAYQPDTFIVGDAWPPASTSDLAYGQGWYGDLVWNETPLPPPAAAALSVGVVSGSPLSLGAGGNATLVVHVANTGGTTIEPMPSLDGLPTGLTMTADLWPALGPGAAADLAIHVAADAGAATWSGSVHLAVRDRASTAQAALDVPLDVGPAPAPVLVLVPPATLAVTPGLAADLDVTAQNDGAANATGLAVRVLLVAGATAAPVNATLAPGGDAALAPGASRVLTLHLLLPAQVPAGATLKLTLAAAEGATAAASISLAVQGAPAGSLRFVGATPAAPHLAAGGLGSVRIALRNDGAAPAPLGGLALVDPAGQVRATFLDDAPAQVDPGAQVELSWSLAADPNATTPYGQLKLDLVGRGPPAVVPYLLDPAAPANATGAVAQPAVGASLPRVALVAGAGVAIVGAGALALARTDAGRVAGAVATLPLYTRLAKADVLQHEVRAGVYAHVLANPGVRFAQMRRELGLANGALVFHLKVLEREGYVTAHKEWTRRRYYGTGRAAPTPVAGVAEAVTGLLRAHPGLALADVASRLGVSRQLADYHLRRLERARRVRRGGTGRAPAWFAADD